MLGGDDGRQLVQIRGDRRHPASKGYACEKAQRLNYYQNGIQRVTEPLRRRGDGTFEAIPWKVAIREVAERLARVRETHGGASIFYYGGGGQGNHLPGAYASATRRALNSQYRSNALAQEKTGEFFVSWRMLQAFTRSDFEHCEVALFIGKNPWHSHSIPRARVALKAIADDPKRALIVIDPRRTETAALADVHLQVRPGCDAWLLAAMIAILLQEDLVDHEFLAAQTKGFDRIIDAFSMIPIAAYIDRAGLSEAQVRAVVRRLARAQSLASFEDLGVQMNRHSTLVSYLHRLIWLMTGNFGKEGTQYVPTVMASLASGSEGKKSPVVGAPLIGGLVPCNLIADEILSGHERRYRAMIVEAANPAHSLADTKRMREALAALDTLVVIDVALTETARLAHYVLPAATQFEKAEATFFNFEFPENYFQLRPRLMSPRAGTISEAEIHARLCEALGVMDEKLLAPLRAAAAEGLAAYGAAFMRHVMADPRASGLASVILYRTLGPTLPEGTAEGAVLFGLAFRFALQHGKALARAGFDGPPPVAAMKLFEAIVDTPSGVVFARDEWDEVCPATGDGRAELVLPEMLDELGKLAAEDELRPFPYVLSAGERRSFTANTIIRNPAWRKKDADGALRISPSDAGRLGLATGGRARLSTERGSVVVTVEVSDSMQAGHISLPNGLGLDIPAEDGLVRHGTAPNELTWSEWRDPIAGTPWHKFIPARLEALS
jgi:anaerobic selenocysteine-containing dehydrogenase